MGKKWLENKQSPRISTVEENRVQEIFGAFLPHVWDCVFFQTPKNDKFPL